MLLADFDALNHEKVNRKSRISFSMMLLLFFAQMRKIVPHDQTPFYWTGCLTLCDVTLSAADSGFTVERTPAGAWRSK